MDKSMIIKTIKELINEVRETRDVYVSIFIRGNDISIGVYPYVEEEEE